MAVIIITGTPGTGKSTLAQLIGRQLGFQRIDVNALIDRKQLCEDYDEARQCRIVDIEKLNRELIALSTEAGEKKENLVIDSHLSQHLPRKYVDLCIVTRCDLKVLQERLAARGYPAVKVRENLDAEIFDNCLTEAEEAGHKVLIVDTTRGVDADTVIGMIQERLGR